MRARGSKARVGVAADVDLAEPEANREWRLELSTTGSSPPLALMIPVSQSVTFQKITIAFRRRRLIHGFGAPVGLSSLR